MGKPVSRAGTWLSWCLVVSLISGLWMGQVMTAGSAEAAESPQLQLGESVQYQSSMVGPGTRHAKWKVNSGSGSQQVNMMQLDPSDPYVAVKTSLARNQIIGRQTLSQQIQQQIDQGQQVIGGINGDFFTMQYPDGIPSDVLIQNGQLVSSPGNGYAFGLTDEGLPVIGKMQLTARLQVGDKSYRLHQVNHTRRENQLLLYTPKFDSSTQTNAYGTEVVLRRLEGDLRPAGTLAAEVVEVRQDQGNTPIQADHLVLSAHGDARASLAGLTPGSQVQLNLSVNSPWDEVVEAIGGHPLLVEQGRIKILPSDPSFDRQRAPRTAVGITGEGEVLMVTVDGRQPGYSAGVTIPELAQMMVDLGAVYALNLDGGDSTTFAVRQSGEFPVNIGNRPSDGTERMISNALLVYSLAPAGEPTYLSLSPSQVKLLGGSRVAFSLKAQDQYYNPVAVPDTLPWSVEGNVGTVTGQGVLQTARSGDTQGRVAVRFGEARHSVPVQVVYQPERIEVAPESLQLPLNGTKQFQVEAYDTNGQPLVASTGALDWQVEGDIGQISEAGRFQADDKPGRGKVVARYADKEVEIPVTVGEPISFPDIANSGVVEEIESLALAGILHGYPDGKFRPLEPMKRAQLAKVLVLSAEWPEDPDAASVFRDVTFPEHQRYVGGLVAQGIANGTSPTTFEPNSPLTRQQMASFFVRAMGLEDLASQLSGALTAELGFTDSQEIDESHLANVALAVEIGLITGIPSEDGSYRYEPLTLAMRQQVARLGYEFYFHGEQYLERADALRETYDIE